MLSAMMRDLHTACCFQRHQSWSLRAEWVCCPTSLKGRSARCRLRQGVLCDAGCTCRFLGHHVGVWWPRHGLVSRQCVLQCDRHSTTGNLHAAHMREILLLATVPVLPAEPLLTASNHTAGDGMINALNKRIENGCQSANSCPDISGGCWYLLRLCPVSLTCSVTHAGRSWTACLCLSATARVYLHSFFYIFSLTLPHSTAVQVTWPDQAITNGRLLRSSCHPQHTSQTLPAVSSML